MIDSAGLRGHEQLELTIGAPVTVCITTSVSRGKTKIAFRMLLLRMIFEKHRFGKNERDSLGQFGFLISEIFVQPLDRSCLYDNAHRFSETARIKVDHAFYAAPNCIHSLFG